MAWRSGVFIVGETQWRWDEFRFWSWPHEFTMEWVDECSVCRIPTQDRFRNEEPFDGSFDILRGLSQSCCFHRTNWGYLELRYDLVYFKFRKQNYLIKKRKSVSFRDNARAFPWPGFWPLAFFLVETTYHWTTETPSNSNNKLEVNERLTLEANCDSINFELVGVRLLNWEVNTLQVIGDRWPLGGSSR